MADAIGKNYQKIISEKQDIIRDEWLKRLKVALEYQKDILTEKELNKNLDGFMTLFLKTIRSEEKDLLSGKEWKELKEHLSQIIQKWASQGFSIRETLSFLLTFERVLFERIREELGKEERENLDEFTGLEELLTELEEFVAEQHVKNREEIIARQQREILELSTPVVTLWKGILAVPLIGTLDSARTQTVMETLLQKIVETGSEIAIIDITGVPAVDTQVAQHIIKTIDAARLMGADCIISGIRPQIAQTMVALGVTFDVVTKATLADAFSIALKRLGFEIKEDRREEK